MGYNGFIRAIRHSALLSGEFCAVNCDYSAKILCGNDEIFRLIQNAMEKIDT